MSQPPEFTFDVAHGDRGVSRQLRESLLIIKSATTDPDVRRQLDDVLAGRASLRSFGTSAAFANIVDGIPKRQLDRTLSMPEDERQRLAEQGERELERLRREPPQSTVHDTGPDERPAPPQPAPGPASEAIIPGTRKPNREQLFIPDEPDEDDLYFQDRRNRGWLQ